jgi:hypothetical protein
MTESTPVRKLLVCILSIALIAAPVLAQTSEVEEARLAAKSDAKRDVSRALWLGAGCLLNILGWGTALVVVPRVPTSRLLGKSSEYVDSYTEAYRTAVRETRANYASIGCVVGTLVTATGVVLGGCLLGALSGMEVPEGCLTPH